MTTAAATIRCLLRDDRGSTLVEWMYPLLLLVIFGALTAEPIGRDWDRARFRLSSEMPFATVLWSF